MEKKIWSSALQFFGDYFAVKPLRFRLGFPPMAACLVGLGLCGRIHFMSS